MPPIDPSIILGVRPAVIQQTDPLETYGRSLQLQNLMRTGQIQQAGIDDDQKLRALFASTPNPTADQVMAINPGKGFAYKKLLGDAAAQKATTDHTLAKTADLNAGHIAGSMAALAKAGGSDDAVRQTSADLAPYIGQAAADARTQKLLAMPQDMRLAYITAQAATHPRGQAALKELFPAAKMQDAGGTVHAVNTSTLPGSPPVGSVVPGSVPLVKTQSPDSRAAVAATYAGQAKPTYDSSRGMMVSPAGVATPVLDAQGKPLEAKPVSNPIAEQIYKDYANHPQVKAANDLETKIKPVMEYMADFAKTGKSNNVKDSALAKLYLAETNPVGNRAYTATAAELSKLPDLGDRIGNAASSFFAGKDLTDATRHDMTNFLVSRYKELNAARQGVREVQTRRAAAKGIPVDQVFGGE